ncbi:hypothetical protein J4526_05935 [Desulfurococcaceae archaeon MEX13E-LK6-19]|nr:hypothetical protein J4526_05935 [Desulfurococcaceae archaeon MEX13E-LK6-19]
MMISRTTAIIIVVCWITIAILSSIYLWIGGVNFWTNIMVLLFLGVAFVVTFGLTAMWPPSSLPEKKLEKELSELKKEVHELKKKIDELRKIIEE